MFWRSVFRYIHIYDCDIFLKNWTLSLGAFLSMTKINMVTQAFFLISVSMVYFSPSFHFNLSKYLHLKWVLYRWHIVGFCFFIHSDNICILIVLFTAFLLKLITDAVRLLIMFVTVCYLFYLLFTILFFLLFLILIKHFIWFHFIFSAYYLYFFVCIN